MSEHPSALMRFGKAFEKAVTDAIERRWRYPFVTMVPMRMVDSDPGDLLKVHKTLTDTINLAPTIDLTDAFYTAVSELIVYRCHKYMVNMANTPLAFWWTYELNVTRAGMEFTARVWCVLPSDDEPRETYVDRMRDDLTKRGILVEETD